MAMEAYLQSKTKPGPNRDQDRAQIVLENATRFWFETRYASTVCIHVGRFNSH